MPKKDSQFSKYLNKNIDLITILGIFNGLTIYSSTLEESKGGYVIGFVFTFLSVLIIRELILKIPKKEGLEFPLISFLFSISFVWLSLIHLLFSRYQSLSSMTALIMLTIGTLVISYNSIQKSFLKKIESSYPKLYSLLSVILMLAIFSASIIFWSHIVEFVSNLFTPVIPKKISY